MHQDVIEVYTDSDGKARWRRKSRNGKTLSQGEEHRSARDAERAARRANPDIEDVRRV
jgi:uncharacterized protein YegP (UPF0339 family)